VHRELYIRRGSSGTKTEGKSCVPHTSINFSTYSFIACSFDIPLILSHASLNNARDQTTIFFCETDRHHLYRSRNENTLGLAVFTSPTVTMSESELIGEEQVSANLV